ncbi:glucosamine-6-phosphate deaminase [Bacillus sp. AFS076308]|uniref:glucosamine-6-phosphate deaminase n=1 Tax=unclassified Bacillus (in: firmicutes) TaxID=185979 RepID=UPI000BF8DA6F|nr:MULTISPECIES: glucosamine-6-phosphate deaminase [unclassified Bacillus (in: firmicutes)]PFN79153.1 glucosamine-6-phosphate deaminase [Bacillus sp. AFS076308]PGV49600.1 glucosamine-6-phosphate deaminase [Bacillus sp. AFS037270]
MKIIEATDYKDMSKIAADYIIQKVNQSPKIKLGLATGGTPMGIYSNLIADHQKNGTSYQAVTTFNLDEYVGLSGDNPNSYRYYMNDNLFNHIDIQKNNTFVPRGTVDDVLKECELYEDLLTKHNGIDLQILGIGANGHIGFNEPGTSFSSQTHVVQLAPSTRQANARFFSSLEEVPTKAITMGIATIMKSKEILLLVSGEAKKEALKRLLTENVDEKFPASVLKNHPCVTIIADKAAIAGLKVHS